MSEEALLTPEASPIIATRMRTLLASETYAIIPLIEACMKDAYDLRASDIHLEPGEHGVRVRMRIDGRLHVVTHFPTIHLAACITRIKVLTGLRTDEHHAAHDGRFHMTMDDGARIDVRVSITPTYYGENAVLRLLTTGTTGETLEALGMHDDDAARVRAALAHPYGMILATGPTGSGKTTTLYTLLKLMNTEDTSIVTIEDPVEYAIPGITHIHINTRTNLTFAHGLRSLLRQDPDIIMVGEIRDHETASIAVNTALTGHLLLSSLHTNDAATTLPRLLDMGIDSYRVASTVSLAIGQRLVRTLCPHCKHAHQPSPSERAFIQTACTDPELKAKLLTSVWGAPGCDHCDQTGFRGRHGIYEVLVVTDRVRAAILTHAPARTIEHIACEEGMTTMLQDGLRKVREGSTSVSELAHAQSHI